MVVERDEEPRAEFLNTIRHGFSGNGNEFVVVDESSKNEHSLAMAVLRRERMLSTQLHSFGESATLWRQQCQKKVTLQCISSLVLAFFDFIVEDVVHSVQ
jgi:hypothetical protein